MSYIAYYTYGWIFYCLYISGISWFSWWPRKRWKSWRSGSKRLARDSDRRNIIKKNFNFGTYFTLRWDFYISYILMPLDVMFEVIHSFIHSFIRSFYFTEHKLHKNNMKNKHTNCSSPLDRKASGTNSCPYRCTHTNTKHKAKRNTKQMSKAFACLGHVKWIFL